MTPSKISSADTLAGLLSLTVVETASLTFNSIKVILRRQLRIILLVMMSSRRGFSKVPVDLYYFNEGYRPNVWVLSRIIMVLFPLEEVPSQWHTPHKSS